MPDPISAIRNLGPAMEQAFQKAGLTTADDIRDLGPDAAYARLIESGTRPHFIGYYSLVMGLQGRPWNDCQGKEKADLRARFDQICKRASTAGPSSDFERELDRLGVRQANQPTSSSPAKK